MMRVLEEIQEIMENNLQGKFKTFYIGEVTPVPQSNLPALMVFGTNTELTAHSTAKDILTHSITIRVLVNVKKQFSQSGTGDIIKIQQEIMDLIEKRETDGTFNQNTILYQLRNNIKGTYYLFNNNIGVEYSRLQPGEFPYVQADITLSAITDTITRP